MERNLSDNDVREMCIRDEYFTKEVLKKAKERVMRNHKMKDRRVAIFTFVDSVKDRRKNK
jgi:hypothetical protein